MNHSLRARLGVFFAVAGILCAASNLVGQETVASYTFAGGSFNNSASSSIASASALNNTNSGGLITSADPRSFYERDLGNAVPASFSAALSANNFLSFTVMPGLDAVNFETLSFDYGASNGTGSVSYQVSWAVFAGASGFTAIDGEQLASGSFSLAAQGANNVTPHWSIAPASINLTGSAGLQNAALTTEFRIYYWDNYATGNNNVIARFDNIALTASVAPIPEPSTYAAMFGAAALGLALWRRRVRHV